MIRIQCPACAATMTVPDGEAGRKGDCPKCGQRLQIPSAAPPQPDPAGGGAVWYYARDGGRSGPYEPAQLRRLVADGRLLPTDMVWKEGMPDWAAAGSVKGLFPGPLPPPPVPPPLPNPAPARSPEKPGAGVLREAKGLLNALGDQIAAKAQDAAASARRAVEATGATPDREPGGVKGVRGKPGASQRQRIWLLAVALFGLLSVLGLCGGMAIIGSRHKDGASREVPLGVTEQQVLNPVLNNGKQDLTKGPRRWNQLPKKAGDRSEIRTWSSGKNALIIKGSTKNVTRVIILIDSDDEADVMAGMGMFTGVQQGILSPGRFDADLGLETLKWFQSQVNKFVASGRQDLRATREVGDVAIVLVLKKGTILFQFRHKSAADDFESVE